MTQSVSSAANFHSFNRHWTWWFTLAVLAIIAAVRISAMNFPLERDEGEYAYAGQLILQGIPPYELAYNMKFPGTYAAYALIMALFGETPAGIHFGVMCMTTLTALMLYWLGKKILDPLAGMVAATCYDVLATESGMFGMSAHATHFSAFFATAGLCAMWLARQKPNWLRNGIAGALFGVAILMIQHAVFICAWAAIVFICDFFRNIRIPFRRRLTNLISPAVGMILPFGICCLWFWRAGVFGKFWFWTIDYARQYVEIRPLSTAWHALHFSVGEILTEDYLLWAIVIAGFVLLWLNNRLKRQRLWLFGLAVASLLTTVPGFYFRTHYFLLALPAFALLAAAAVETLRQFTEQHFRAPKFQIGIPCAFYILLLGVTLFQNRGVWSFFARAQGGDIFLAHKFFGDEPFPEAEVISKWIDAHSKPDARVAVLGSEPEIYFLSHRHSATGFIYMYPLMEPQPFARQMQRNMIREIETNSPEFIVFASMNSSWFATRQSDMKIFEWWRNYQTNYTLAGFADMDSPADIRFVFGADAIARYGRIPTNGVSVFQRITKNIAPK